MKKRIIRGIIVFAVLLLAPQITNAQGTTYLSNLSQSSARNRAVGSDAWLAVGFETGNNASGYVLDSIQLAMIDSSGSPNAFAVMLYSAIGQGDYLPGNSFVTLNGSLSPVTGGIYTYTTSSSTILSPNTAFFMVLTSGTTIANGTYNWSYANTFSYNSAGNWRAPLGQSAVDDYQSSNGLNWSFVGGPSQFAITATPVPEPSAGMLVGFGGILLLGFGRWKAKAV